MTAAIYARYSSDLQSERSIDDQVAACRSYAERHGLTGPFAIFSDAGLSGASMATRPQLQALLALVRGRKVRVVIAEALDRLSRDQADIALIHRAVKSAGARLLTLSEGEVGVMHIGLAGTMNHLYLEELARKTRRGLIGVAKSGRSAGGRCYGYRVVDGDVRGVREIDSAEAAIVVRIFQAYAAGASPLAICKALNGEGVRAPRGGVWRVTALNGSPAARDGLLAQELYRGRIVFNRRAYSKDPETGRRRATLNPDAEWIVRDAPELRIVPERLWLAVQARRQALSLAPAPHLRKRPKRLLSGLVRCGLCGAPFTIVGKESLGCAAVRATGICDQRRTYAPRRLERRVLAGLKAHLLAPELIGEAVRAYHEEMRAAAQERARLRGEIDRDLAEARRRAERIAGKIIDAEGPSPTLAAQLRETEQRIAALEGALALEPAPDVVAMHPAAADLYRARISDLDAALNAPHASLETREAIRDLIERIDLTPDAGEPDGWRVTVFGQLGALLDLASGQQRPSVKLGAGAGFEPTTFRL